MKFNFKVGSKKHLITFFAFVIVSCSALAQSIKEQEVLSLSERKFKWMINLNMDSLENILDENVMYVHSNGWTQNKQEIIEDFRTKKLVLNKVEILETKIRNFENTYIVNGVGIITGEINSSSFSVKLNYSEVYIYKNRKYFLFSRHANKIN
jgi:uncharacterized secreted protein with C-terminal beta-propeller domain